MKTVEVYEKPSLLGGLPWDARRVKFKNFEEEARKLREMVDEGTRNLALRELTLKIVMSEARAKAEADQALAIGRWVQDHIYYVHEGQETFQKPETTLRLRAGDCDDFSVLICSMLGNVGIRNKLCVLRRLPDRQPFHIFPIAFVKQDGEQHRLTLDATLDQPIDELVNPIALCLAAGRKVEPVFF